MKKLYPVLLMLAIMLGSCSGDDSNEQLSNEPEVVIPPATNTPPNETPPVDETPPDEQQPGEEHEGINGKWRPTHYIDYTGNPAELAIIDNCLTYIRWFKPDMTSVYYDWFDAPCEFIVINGVYSIDENVLTITNANNSVIKANILELTQTSLKLEYFYHSGEQYFEEYTLIYQRY